MFSAVLRPHRSAGLRGVRNVVIVLAGLWLPFAIGFTLAGAWPVLPFLGLELVLLYALLRWNLRAGNAIEAINLTEAALTVRRVDHWGNERQFAFPPQWLQVNLDVLGPHENRLELRSHGRSLTIARCLQPAERVDLARVLRRELSRLTASPSPEPRAA
jgi:uncharacterized membrane protein